MPTSAYYNFLDTCVETAKPKTKTVSGLESRRLTALSPSSYVTSHSDSSSSLNQFNSITQTSTTTSSASASCSSSSSSTSSTNSITAAGYINHSMTRKSSSPPTMAPIPTNHRDIIRRSSVTPTQMHRPHLLHSHTLQSLEPKPLKPFKSKDAYVEAMKEDLADWFNRLYSDLELTSDNFFSQLETGAIICRHSNHVTQMGRNAMLEQSTSENTSLSTDSSYNEPNNNNGNSLGSLSPDQEYPLRRRYDCPVSNTSNSSTVSLVNKQSLSPIGSLISSPKGDRVIDWFRIRMLTYKPDAKPGTFFARDNICQFILWCRSLNILECLLFETDDLVARKNERSFILCMLEVARIGFKVGMPTPLIIQLEQEIDQEIENEAKMQRGDHSQTKQSITDEEVDMVTKKLVANELGGVCEQVSREANVGLKKQSYEDLGSEELEDLTCEQEYGPKPQVVTNDLMSLHERVVQLLCQCTCPTQFPMVRIGDGKYKVGDKLIIFVRILRRHIMVRVGGGWQELSEFLRQKDPCRTKSVHTQSHHQYHPLSTSRQPSITMIPDSTEPRSRFVGSSHYLNKGHNLYRNSSGHRLISSSASMSWLSNNP